MTVRQLFMIVDNSLKDFISNFKVFFFIWSLCTLPDETALHPVYHSVSEKFYSLLGLESRYVI